MFVLFTEDNGPRLMLGYDAHSTMMTSEVHEALAFDSLMNAEKYISNKLSPRLYPIEVLFCDIVDGKLEKTTPSFVSKTKKYFEEKDSDGFTVLERPYLRFHEDRIISLYQSTNDTVNTFEHFFKKHGFITLSFMDNALSHYFNIGESLGCKMPCLPHAIKSTPFTADVFFKRYKTSIYKMLEYELANWHEGKTHKDSCLDSHVFFHEMNNLSDSKDIPRKYKYMNEIEKYNTMICSSFESDLSAIGMFDDFLTSAFLLGVKLARCKSFK